MRLWMTKRVALLVAILALLEASSTERRKDYSGSQMIQVKASPSNIQEILSHHDDYDVDLWQSSTTDVNLFVQANKLSQVKDLLDKNNLHYKVQVEDVQVAINKALQPLSDEELSQYRSKGYKMTWRAYHRLEDIHDYLDFLAQKYPNIVNVTVIGRTYERRPLKMIKISSGKPKSKAVWIDGGTHAREWITPASATYIIKELVENRSNYSDIVGDIDFFILPVVNPDGYEYSLTINAAWRKNRVRIMNSECVGTDLNRNWGYKWGGAGMSRNPCDKLTYGGPRPFSERETSAISNFLMANKVNMKGYLTIHSFGAFVVYPWGYKKNEPLADKNELHHTALRMANAMKRVNGHKYEKEGVGSSSEVIYESSGASTDWAKGVAGIKYVYAIEMYSCQVFQPEKEEIEHLVKEAMAAVKVLATAIKTMS